MLTPSRGALAGPPELPPASWSSLHPRGTEAPSVAAGHRVPGGLSPGQWWAACVNGLPVTQSRLCHRTTRALGSAVTQVPEQPASWGPGHRQRPLSPVTEMQLCFPLADCGLGHTAELAREQPRRRAPR